MANEELAECDIAARLLFIYLWMLADREGRLEDRPKRIGAQALPYDRSEDVEALLQQLHDNGFILRYQVDEGKYIQILTFSEHQTPHVKEKPSTIPSPDLHQTSTVQAPDKPDTKPEQAPPDSLIPDSLIPDSPNAPETPDGDPGDPPPEKPKPAKYKFEPEHLELATRMADPVRRRHPSQPVDLDAWADAIRKLIDLDKRPQAEIMPLWIWITNHDKPDFSWADNCRTPMKLRDKDRQGMPYWDVIQAQRQRDMAQARGSPPPAKPSALHNFDQVNYEYGRNPDGTF